MADELDQLISDLTSGAVKTNTSQSIPQPVASTLSEQKKYQIPVKIGKKGLPLDAGDESWIVGTFVPQHIYLNKNHDGRPTAENPSGAGAHLGTDLKAPAGTPVYPIAPGEVVDTKPNLKGGNICKVAHENGKVISYYAHLQEVRVQQGQQVDFSTVLGTVGVSGNAKHAGAHLHFQVKVNGADVDPMGVISKPVGSLTGKTAELISHCLNKINQLIWEGGQLKKIASYGEILERLTR